MLMFLSHGGGGIERPSDNPDFAYVLHQVYVYLTTHSFEFTFNGTFFSFTYWQCFCFIVAFEVILWMVSEFYVSRYSYGQ